jgi:hypothetical protein
LKKLFDEIVILQKTDFQHAYREGHSTCSALTKMTPNWLKEIDNKEIVGAVLLDFSAAFDVIDHNLLLRKCGSYRFASSALLWIESYLSSRTQGLHLIEASHAKSVVWCSTGQYK